MNRPIIKCTECGSNYRDNPDDPGCARCLMNEQSAQVRAARHARWLAENPVDRPGRTLEELFGLLGQKVPGR